MRQQGIFGGLGADELSGQTLNLRTVNAGGSATENPLATALQTVLRDRFGYTNLKVDGKWGGCSESAFQKFTGQPTSGANVAEMLGLFFFGNPNVNGWGNANPTCSDAAQAQPVSEPNAEIDPLLVVAKSFGISNPETCIGGKADISKGTCVCPTGYVFDTRGKCYPGSLASKTRFSLVPTTKTKFSIEPSSTSVLRILPMTPTTPGSDTKMTVLPVSNSSSKNTFSSVYKNPYAFSTTGGSGGMTSNAKVALGIGVLAVLGLIAGGIWWMNKDSATPNCGE